MRYQNRRFVLDLDRESLTQRTKFEEMLVQCNGLVASIVAARFVVYELSLGKRQSLQLGLSMKIEDIVDRWSASDLSRLDAKGVKVNLLD
jgi:hypothetical protein